MTNESRIAAIVDHLPKKIRVAVLECLQELLDTNPVADSRQLELHLYSRREDGKVFDVVAFQRKR